MITSKQNPRVKLVHELQNRPSSRRRERKIVLEGARLIRDAIQYKTRPEYILYQPGSAGEDLIAELRTRQIKLYPVSEDVMKHLSDTQNPQGILGIFPFPKPPIPPTPEQILILDAIREPGNMGTILRTAGAADIQLVILRGCVDPYNPKALRAAMGAHFRIPIVEAFWKEIQAFCADLSVYLATGQGAISYTEIDWTRPWALIIGNEARGASEDATQIAKDRIFIPMATETESLNAAVATGVILFEAQRQRKIAAHMATKRAPQTGSR